MSLTSMHGRKSTIGDDTIQSYVVPSVGIDTGLFSFRNLISSR